jgi:hypothetical protein
MMPKMSSSHTYIAYLTYYYVLHFLTHEDHGYISEYGYLIVVQSWLSSVLILNGGLVQVLTTPHWCFSHQGGFRIMSIEPWLAK